MINLKKNIPEYSSRETRNKFISIKFLNYLSGSVLNVGGGGKKHLSKYIKSKEYMELDIDGEPDLLINLDQEFPLPIEDKRYNTVICSDVLEHLNDFHRVFSELIRVSNRYVIISLPNCLPVFYQYLRRQKYIPGNSDSSNSQHGRFSKYYGLPFLRPSDRHRWFFSYTDAERFVLHHSTLLNYKILEEYPIGAEGFSFKSKLARKIVNLIWGKEVVKDWFYGTYWCVLEKNEE